MAKKIDLNRGAGEFIVPTDARAEFRALIQRANRRVKSNLRYIEKHGITDNEVKTSLAADFTSKGTWETKTMPFSRSIKFASKKDYDDYVRHVKKWGEDRGAKGDFHAAPENLRKGYQDNIIKALNTVATRKGISLEKWGGDLPPAMIEKIEKMSLQQLFHFFKHVKNDQGDEEELDSDRVLEGSEKSYIGYMHGLLNRVTKFYN